MWRIFGFSVISLPVSALEKLYYDASKATCYHTEGVVKMFANQFQLAFKV